MQLPLLLFLSAVLLSSCVHDYGDLLNSGGAPGKVITAASILDLQSDELKNLPAAKRQPTIAVYENSFKDFTGQRDSNSKFALFSTATTQAPEALVIRALKHAANGKFFKVVERVGLDSLTKERQIIRSTRENFDEDQQLKPLLFAGILLQGGIISYETNEKSGGLGARYFGISSSKQYREDTVTISLRLVSVSTGEILTEVLVSKSILSVSVSHDIFRFFEVGTRLFEFEGGTAQNESGVIALQKAIETGVLKLINIGIESGYWQYEETN